MYKMGAIGAGHMGMIILDSIVDAGHLRPSDVLVYDHTQARAEEAAARGYVLAADECEVFGACTLMLLAVLPQQCEAALEKLAGCVAAKPPVVLSIVSGIGSGFIQRYLGPETAVIHIVPNLTLSVGAGATALARTANTPEDLFQSVVRMFSSLGETAVMAEHQLKEIIAANGCAPGYAFYFIDAVARAVAKRGVDYDLAMRLVAKSFAGAAEMALETGKKPQTLLAQVCSPGGLTVQAIDHFNANGLDAVIAEAVQKSIMRGHELAR